MLYSNKLLRKNRCASPEMNFNQLLCLKKEPQCKIKMHSQHIRHCGENTQPTFSATFGLGMQRKSRCRITITCPNHVTSDPELYNPVMTEQKMLIAVVNGPLKGILKKLNSYIMQMQHYWSSISKENKISDLIKILAGSKCGQ